MDKDNEQNDRKYGNSLVSTNWCWEHLQSQYTWNLTFKKEKVLWRVNNWKVQKRRNCIL